MKSLLSTMAMVLAAIVMLAMPGMDGAAQAQSNVPEVGNENNARSQVGTRFLREPETADAAEARYMQKRVARCVYDRNEDEVRELLANSNFYSIDFAAIGYESETFFEEFGVRSCIGRLMRRADNRTYQMYMSIQYSTLRNLLAEEAYLGDYGAPAVTGNDAQQDIAERFAGERVHPQISTMAAMVDCMTFHAGDAAHALLSARPGSDEEVAAIDVLGPVIAGCANTSETELSIPTSLIRQMAADGMWTRSYYAAGGAA